MSASRLAIVHLVESLERGGLERVVVDLALEQSAAGHSVAVVCLFGKGVLAGELAARGIEVAACDKRPGPDFGAVRRIRRLLRERCADVLHTHNAVAHYYGALAAFFAGGVTVVNTRHGMGNFPFSRRREALYRLLLARTPAVAMVCATAAANFVRHGIVTRRKSRVVHNGIRIDRFAPAGEAERMRAREMAQVPMDAFCVGHVGRLNPAKDQATLVRAMAQVRRTVPDALLVMVGGGALEPELRALGCELGIDASIRWLGDRGDVEALLPAFDLFALTSVTEGYSVSLLEACASALPIVATDVGGNAEIVRSGENGRIVRPGDVSGIAAAIVELARDAEARRDMGRRGREWIEAHGTVGAMAGRYADLYRAAKGIA